MRWWVVALCALVPAVAMADEKPTAQDEARWQKCAGLGQTIMDRTGAVYERTSEMDHNVFMRHPSVNDLSMTCAPYLGLGTSGSWNRGGYPPDRFYQVLGVATSVVTGDSPVVLASAIRKCHDLALKPGADETAEANTPKTHIECQAFTRDGGGTTVSTWEKIKR